MALDSSPTYDVVGLGCCCWDLLCVVPRPVGPDEKMELLDFTQQGGGLVATALVAVARLGGSTCYIGRVGDDDFGQKLTRAFLDEGVSIEGLQTFCGCTSQFATVIVQREGGHRAIIYAYGSHPFMEAADVPADLVRSSRVLLVDFHHPQASIEAARIAREAGIPTVLDIERCKQHTEQLLALSDYPIVPERFACEFGGTEDLRKAARAFERFGHRALIVTQGDRGATAFAEGKVFLQPAFKIAPVVDTTGAGDAFHGAFAYGLALGYDLMANLRFSAAVAALKCRRLGGRAGIPSMDEVSALLRDGELVQV